MLADRKGAELVEWIVVVVIVVAVIGSSVFGLFQALGAKFDDVKNAIPTP